MHIRPVSKARPGDKFRPVYALLDESRRVGHGHGQLVNVSWVARSIQSAINTGIDCENIFSAVAPATKLARLMDTTLVSEYRRYASRLSIYDCANPLIVIFKGDTPPKRIDDTCEILDGKARVVRGLGENISLPVILISENTASSWGMPSQLRMLGLREKPIRVGSKYRNHRQLSGHATLPSGSSAGNAVISHRVEMNRAAGGDTATNPFAYSLILSSDRGVRKEARERLCVRGSAPRGLIDAFPEIKKPGRPPLQYQEKCLLILIAKLLQAGCSLDDLIVPARHLLRYPVDKKSLKCVWQNDQVAQELEKYAKRARAALRKAPSPWHEPLSERLLLFSATRAPSADMKDSDKEAVLKQHKVELLQWTFYALFRTKHWRIGRNLIERFNIKDDGFPNPDDDDPTEETRTVPRIHHEVAGSVAFQNITDLTVEQLLIVSMHARTNLFLVQHDFHWAIPLGHWAMAIADLDVERPTHVSVWMAELYEEQRRRQFSEDTQNPFTGPSTMILHWLHWVCGDVRDFAKRMANICELVIDGFPELNGRLIEIKLDQDSLKTLDSEPLEDGEDCALQATLFA
ncbi:MAG: hypothetical protein GY837_09920 [Bosea sp.]|uniref:hypothetical protein n=1 Tax=Bosea sp. (in: a-proteobacteria) TaxID=1871050 RepID=UPI0031FEC9F9|nr:hypothetical protein [Bosea sp. (in: a-proteobacteria)]